MGRGAHHPLMTDTLNSNLSAVTATDVSRQTSAFCIDCRVNRINECTSWPSWEEREVAVRLPLEAMSCDCHSLTQVEMDCEAMLECRSNNAPHFAWSAGAGDKQTDCIKLPLRATEDSGVAPANQTKERAKNEKFMNFARFCKFWCFSLGKQARFTLNFCSGMPLRKVHELTFLWFGLPGPLLISVRRQRDFSFTDQCHLLITYPRNRGIIVFRCSCLSTYTSVTLTSATSNFDYAQRQHYIYVVSVWEMITLVASTMFSELFSLYCLDGVVQGKFKALAVPLQQVLLRMKGKHL